MKKIQKLTLMTLTCLALSQFAVADSEKTKIGFISTLSGGGATSGLDIRDGFLLAVEQAKQPNLTVIVEDDQQKPAMAVRLADKLIQSDKVDILTGIVFSNIAMAVVPSSVRQGKFYVSPNAGPSALAGKGCHPNYFNAAWQNDNLHESAAAYANKLGYKNSFILAPNYPAGIDALNGYKRYFEGQLAGELKTKFGQTDYAAEIAQIRASGADSLFFFLPGAMGISFLKQYADSGIDTPLIGSAFSFDQTLLKAVGEAAEGAINTSQWSHDLDNTANKQFVTSFKEKYGRLPSAYASQGYDTANLIISAIRKAAVKDKEAFRAALKAADFESVRGKFVFGKNQHPIQNFYARQVVKEVEGYTNKVIGTAFTDHVDAYADQCKM